MRPEPDSDVVLHDAVVKHARFGGFVQTDGHESEPCVPDFGFFERVTEEVLAIVGAPRHNLPGPDSVPRVNDRATGDENGVRRMHLAVRRLGTDSRRALSRWQRGFYEPSAEVRRADDSVVDCRRNRLGLEPQVGATVGGETDRPPALEPAGERGARSLNYFQVNRQRGVVASGPICVVESIRRRTLRRDAPDREVHSPHLPSPLWLVLSQVPE